MDRRHATGPGSARRLLASAVLLCAGLAIAWMDTRPGWDDTGVTAGTLALATAGGALAGLTPLLAAALCAAPLIVAELPGGTGVLIAIPVALFGAAVGWLGRARSRRP